MFKPKKRKMQVHSATCSFSIALYKQCYTLADFLPKLGHFAGFSIISFMQPQGSAQLRWVGNIICFRVQRSSECCGVAQRVQAQLRGYSVALRVQRIQLNAAYLRGIAKLNRVQCSSLGCSGAQEGAALLRKMQCSSVGCSLAQWKIYAPGGASSGLRERFGGYIHKKQQSCHRRAGVQRPFGMLMSPKRRVRAAHGRARAAKNHQLENNLLAITVQRYCRENGREGVKDMPDVAQQRQNKTINAKCA